MQELPGQLLVAVGAIIAALIAGAFSYFNLITAKESKVSEFRQQWIDALRQEIATYVSRIRTLMALGVSDESSNTETNLELLKERSRLHEEALAAYSAIHLRINKNEVDKYAKGLNDEFIKALEDAQEDFEFGDNDLKLGLKEVISKAAPVLKHEWNRVRAGESSYRCAKWMSWIIIIGAFVGFAVMVFLFCSPKMSIKPNQPQSFISKPLPSQGAK